MATLVFDIETVAEPWDVIDAYTKKQLLRGGTDEAEVKSKLGLSPFTGQIVSVAMYDIERKQGAVYYVGNSKEVSPIEEDFFIKERTEREILEDFWEGANSYDVFVTFNGRAFDIPFLIHRSLACGVSPSLSFTSSRYLTKQQLPYHVDLMDEFTFYGAMNKRPSLYLLCRAYGIDTERLQVDGAEVEGLFHREKFHDLIRHNINNTNATTALFEVWKKYLAPKSFLNTIEF